MPSSPSDDPFSIPLTLAELCAQRFIWFLKFDASRLFSIKKTRGQCEIVHFECKSFDILCRDKMLLFLFFLCVLTFGIITRLCIAHVFSLLLHLGPLALVIEGSCLASRSFARMLSDHFSPSAELSRPSCLSFFLSFLS
jgi:hypothetical protein